MTDQEIRNALRVDPSPEFLARVRTRIASEPTPSAWRWSWTLAAAGALVATVLIAVVLSRPRHQHPPAPDGVHAFTPAEAPAGPTLQQTEPAGSTAIRRPGPLGPGDRRSAKAAAHATPVVSGSGRTVTREAEVLLDPSETRALRALITGGYDGRVDLAVLQRDPSRAPMDLDPIAGIIIAPITIEPIAPPSGAEGVRP